MKTAAVDKIAKALLYEGYLLYPYRPSAIKNQQRFNFGVLYPRPYSHAGGELEPWFSKTECLVSGSVLTAVEIRIRFLHLCDRTVQAFTDENSWQLVDRLEVAGKAFQPWQEAVEGEIVLPVASLQSLTQIPLEWPCLIPAKTAEERINNQRGSVAGRLLRVSREMQMMVKVAAESLNESVFKVSVQVENVIESGADLTRESALLQSPISTHTLLGVQDGEFVSLLETPEELVPFARDCVSVGCYPVLAGDRGSRDTVLSSPIILYDYPEVAAESDGDLFDATEIDEILSLRILTLTDEEKREVRNSDDRARQILERTETIPQEQLLKLHGVLRGLHPSEGDLR